MIRVYNSVDDKVNIKINRLLWRELRMDVIGIVDKSILEELCKLVAENVRYEIDDRFFLGEGVYRV